MRLIDADELMRSHCVECTYYNSGECLGGNCDWDSIGHIREAKTVEAIPVKWLFERVPKIDQVMKLYNTKLIEYIVIMWREENETN